MHKNLHHSLPLHQPQCWSFFIGQNPRQNPKAPPGMHLSLLCGRIGAGSGAYLSQESHRGNGNDLSSPKITREIWHWPHCNHGYVKKREKKDSILCPILLSFKTLSGHLNLTVWDRSKNKKFFFFQLNWERFNLYPCIQRWLCEIAEIVLTFTLTQNEVCSLPRRPFLLLGSSQAHYCPPPSHTTSPFLHLSLHSNLFISSPRSLSLPLPMTCIK